MPDLRTEFDSLTEPEIRSTVKAMRRALKKMREIVKSGRDSSFDLFVARQKAQAIEREITALERELKQRFSLSLRRAVAVADELNTEAPLNPIGVDASIAARAESEAGRYIKDVTDRMRRDINQVAVQAATGEMDHAQFEQGIADVLDTDVMDARVERIARTEMGGIFEGQGAEADQRLAEQGSDLIKVWSHKCGGRSCFGARPGHVQMHGQERELWQPFNVGGGDPKTGAGGATAETPPGSGLGHEAMRPLDSSLPAGDKINCGCSVVRRQRSDARQAYMAKVNPRDTASGPTVAADRAPGADGFGPSRLAASTTDEQP